MLSGGTLKMQQHHQCTKNTMNSHPSNAEFAGLVDVASCRCNLDGGASELYTLWLWPEASILNFNADCSRVE